MALCRDVEVGLHVYFSRLNVVGASVSERGVRNNPDVATCRRIVGNTSLPLVNSLILFIAGKPFSAWHSRVS